MLRKRWFWLALILGVVFRKQLSLLATLPFINPQQTLANPQNMLRNGLSFEETQETATYTRHHTVQDGIERIAYIPKNRRFETPILMLHGMWHGAWCWRWWQELLAEMGWETHSFSLPGHGKSPEQRPIEACTLDYYLAFLKSEVERFDMPPVLMGHSMGGAITQWYLKYVRDDLPAVVLVASWVSHSAMEDGGPLLQRLDPWGMVLTFLNASATPFVRTPQHAAAALISERAIISPSELHANLGPESALVTMQHNPPLWEPKASVKAPMLYVAGEIDAVVSQHGSRETARYYKADFIMAQQAAHNVMMEHNYDTTAQQIHDWLVAQDVK